MNHLNFNSPSPSLYPAFYLTRTNEEEEEKEESIIYEETKENENKNR